MVLESVRALANAVVSAITRPLCENNALRLVELSEVLPSPRLLPMNDDREVAMGSDAPTYTADMRTEPFGGVNCSKKE